MKLNFHGAKYDRQTLNITTVDHEENGKYRGLDVTIHQHSLKQRYDRKMEKGMIYRGVSYIA